MVDDVAFGLARTQAATPERRGALGPRVFEHYRNDGLPEAAAVLDATEATLEEIARFEVGPDTSNQWLLRVRLGAESA